MDASASASPGAAHLASIPPADRRREGQVYTPVHLVEFILDQVGYVASEPLEARPLLDPACGAGAFLAAAVARLALRFEARGLRLSTPAGRDAFASTVRANVVGVDTDPVACRLAAEAVKLAVARACQDDAVPACATIVQADFLLDSIAERLMATCREGFAFVAGNPPYVPATRLSAGYKLALRNRYRAARGRIDLYTSFIERSVSMLAKGGRLAFITPDKFLSSQSARSLRELLLESCGVRTVVTFQSHRVFDEAATVPCITVLERDLALPRIDVLECGHARTPSGSVSVLARRDVSSLRFTADRWDTTPPELSEIAVAIRSAHPTLASVAERISAGIATGLDDAFVLPTADSRRIEPSLLRAAVRGRDLLPFRINDPGLAMIVPYSFETAAAPRLVDLARFPGAFARLGPRRQELERRHCVRVWSKAWHDLHDPMPCDVAKLPKILVPDVAESNRFVYDPGRYLPLHSVYYVVPRGVDPLYLTALLNSSPIEFLVRLESPVVKDGFSRYRKQFLVTLPVPRATPEAARGLVDAAAAGRSSELDACATRLFGLSSDQTRALERYLELRRRSASRDGGR